MNISPAILINKNVTVIGDFWSPNGNEAPKTVIQQMLPPPMNC